MVSRKKCEKTRFTFVMGSVVKNLPANVGVWFQSMGQEESLEKEMVTHPSILAWKIPWTEESGGYSPRGLKESDMTELRQENSKTLYL